MGIRVGGGGAGGGGVAPVRLFDRTIVDDEAAGGFFDPRVDGGLTASVADIAAITDAPFFEIRAADLAVPGKTTRLRTRLTVRNNGVASLISMQARVYGPATIAGLTTTMPVTDGPQVDSAAVADPGISGIGSAQSAGIALPADGLYRVYLWHSAGKAGRQLVQMLVEAYYVV